MQHFYTHCYETGDGQNQSQLGVKGANLCQLTQLGINVPPGFVISRSVSEEFQHTNTLPDDLQHEINAQIRKIETQTGKFFGGENDPLLLSVRLSPSTIEEDTQSALLNLGLNSITVAGLLESTDDPRFVYDVYRRFIYDFGVQVLGVDHSRFDFQSDDIKQAAGINMDSALNSVQLEHICQRYLSVIRQSTGQIFPEDVYQQLSMAITSRFLPPELDSALGVPVKNLTIKPSAVAIVTMVFGNLGDDCASGLAYTRDPETGKQSLCGHYLINAQGDDVTAGIRHPKLVSSLSQELPQQYKQLTDLAHKLEAHYQEIQQFEFTVERGVVYCLQSRNADLTAAALIKSSVDMVKAKLISQQQALLRIPPDCLQQLLHPQLRDKHNNVMLASGIPASPGAATGKCVFDAEQAIKLTSQGESVILLREETKPDDINGFALASGILTTRGGKTSNAAVVARGIGKPCVVGAEAIKIDSKAYRAVIGDLQIHEGDSLTIDGSNGAVYSGQLAIRQPSVSADLQTLLTWADNTAKLQILANADTPETAEFALQQGAQGIGLCRTERMFNASDRLPIVVDMILADSSEEREDALAKLFPIQRDDIEAMMATLSPHSLTIRLLDPPMHEFLPDEQQLIDDIDALTQFMIHSRGQRLTTETLGRSRSSTLSKDQFSEDDIHLAISKKNRMLSKVRELYEINPMLGHRGVRLGITYPEIYAMQIRSILEASARCLKRKLLVKVEIMVPQVMSSQELIRVKNQALTIQAEVEELYKVKLDYRFGSMVETVRACTRANNLAEVAEFFSFGTNDLTQSTFSFSREDAENKFLAFYAGHGILKDDPFEVLDIKGVGKLMEMAVDLGRSRRTDLRIGICGEHGGNPTSIYFCHDIGLDFVSCSAPRIPIARLAAAQAQLRNPR